MDTQVIFNVMQTPYFAKGDGVTNDRAAIQRAIDDAAGEGGGTVVLEAGKTFLSGNLVIKNNVELHFGDGAVLLQSSNPEDYIKPADSTEYEMQKPQYGHNISEVKWSHLWYYNYPLLFALEGAKNIKVTGKGTVKMMPDDEPEKILRICPVGFYRVDGFEISDIHITNYHSYAMMPFTSKNGLIKDVQIDKWSYGNGDGICLMNCQNIHITGCKMFTGDDSIYIFSSYKDPRKSEWWSSDEPQPSLNIEIDHNELRSNHCKAFGMILWGIDCPDQSLVEVRNLYVHDNYFQTLGNWNYNPYTTKAGYPPVTHVRFENNVIDAIEPNFFETQITDMNYFHSSKKFINGDFANGFTFWSMKKNENPLSICIEKCKIGEEEAFCGCISHFDEGDTALYQGLYISSHAPCCFWAKLQTSGCTCRMFVRNLDTGETVATREFSNTELDNVLMDFSVSTSANYYVGIENVDNTADDWARITNANLLGNCDAAFGYARVGTDYGRNWKPLYYNNPNLWIDEAKAK